MNKKSLDLIIPAYNSFNMLVRALSSVALQKIDFPLNVIIVNDCSKRDYKKEIMMFVDKLNIKEIVLKNNRGVGVARQIGLDNSNGDYVMFLDCDDVLYDSMALKTMYDLISEKDADYAYSAIIIEEGSNRNLCFAHDGCLHGKIINRKLINKYNIKFNITRTSEDNSFNHICSFKAKKICTTEKVTYIYKDNKTSLTKGLSIDKIISNIVDFTNNILYTLSFIDNKLEKKYILYYLNGYFHVWQNYGYYKKKYPEESKKILECIELLESSTPYYTDEILNNAAPELAFGNFRNSINE